MTSQQVSSTTQEPPFFILLILICFASVCAVLFTPALPSIADHFHVNVSTAQLTVMVYLLGYTIGQLLYSPFANRFGRRTTLMLGIGLEIVSSLLCAVTVWGFPFLVIDFGPYFNGIGCRCGFNDEFWYCR